MAGEKWFDRRFTRALVEAGIPVQTHHWTNYWLALRNLRDRKQHERAETELIAMIRSARSERPDAPIVLVGHSTGCLIILEALEQMDEPIDRAVLLAAAVRPDYDLTKALRNVHRMVHIGSPLDLVFVGLGTAVFGCADGCHRPGAGFVGFHGPGHDDPRFEQRMFRLPWLGHYHHGGHIGPLHPRFARQVILPIIRGEGEGTGTRD